MLKKIFHKNLNTIKYYTKRSFLLNLSDIVGSFLLFILNVFLIKKLSPQVYGKYKYFLSLLSVISLFGLSGLNQFYMRSIVKKKEPSIIKSLPLKLIFASFPVIFCVISFFVKTRNDLILAYYFLTTAVMFFPYFSLSIFRSWYSGKERFNDLSFFNIAEKILFLAIISVGFYFLDNDISYFLIFLYLFPKSLINMFNFLVIYNKTKENRSAEYVKPGLKLSLMNFLFSGTLEIDAIIIKIFGDFEQVATYSLALVFLSFFKILISNLVSVIFPVFCKFESIKELWSKIKLRIIYLYISGIFVSIGVYFIIPIVIRFFPENYQNGVGISRILIMSFLIFGLNNRLLKNIILSQGNLKWHFRLRLFISISRILTLVIFTYYLGSKGTAIARAIMYLVVTLSSLFVVNRISKSSSKGSL